MNKFNKQFNSKIKRLNKWQDVISRLSEFEGLLHSFDGLSPHDVVSLKIIHKKLYEAIPSLRNESRRFYMTYKNIFVQWDNLINSGGQYE